MGWNPCNAAQAKYCANHGYAAIGVTKNSVVIILPEDEAVTVDNALPKVSHPAARKLSELQEEETADMLYFVYAILLEDLEPTQSDEEGNIRVAAAASTTCSSCQSSCQTNCQKSCQTSCQVSCQSCNTCQSTCQTSCQTCNSCQTTCEKSCQTCQSGNTTTKVTYKIAFNANDGKFSDNTTYYYTIIDKGTYVILPEPTRENYHLVGWYKKITSATGTLTRPTVGNAGDKYYPDESCTLYANWSDQATYTVSYSLNGGSGISLTSQTAKKGEEITLKLLENLRDCYKLDHTFDGWNTKADGSGTLYPQGSKMKVNSNVTLYAKFTKKC